MIRSLVACSFLFTLRLVIKARAAAIAMNRRLRAMIIVIRLWAFCSLISARSKSFSFSFSRASYFVSSSATALYVSPVHQGGIQFYTISVDIPGPSDTRLCVQIASKGSRNYRIPCFSIAIGGREPWPDRHTFRPNHKLPSFRIAIGQIEGIGSRSPRDPARRHVPDNYS